MPCSACGGGGSSSSSQRRTPKATFKPLVSRTVQNKRLTPNQIYALKLYYIRLKKCNLK